MAFIYFFIVFATFCCVSSKFVSNRELREFSTAGLTEITTQLKESVSEYEGYQKEVVKAQENCRTIMEPQKQQCSECMQQKCTAKIQDLSCTDEEMPNWRERIRTVFQEMKDNIKKFFDDKFPKFVQLTKDVGNYFKWMASQIKEKMKNAFTSMKEFFESWGRRKRSPERLIEPSTCEDFETDEKMKTSCEYFSTQCAACKPTTDHIIKECPKIQELMTIGKQYNWLHFALTYTGSDFFRLDSIYYDPNNLADGAQVTANVFGEDLTFTTNERGFDINEKDRALPILVKDALNAYRNNYLESNLEEEEH